MKINKKIVFSLISSFLLLVVSVYFSQFQYLVIEEIDQVEDNGQVEKFENDYDVTPQEIGRKVMAMEEEANTDDEEIVYVDNGESMVLGARSTPRFALTFIENTYESVRVRYNDVSHGDVIKDNIVVTMLDNTPSLVHIDIKPGIAQKLAKTITGIDALALETWVEFPNGKQLVFYGSEQIQVPFEITVPEGVAPGDYVGLFSASLVDYGDEFLKKLEAVEGEVEKLRETETVGIGAKVAIGVGLDFILRIAGEAIPNLFFANLGYDVTEETGMTLLVDYENRGNVTIVPSVNVVISDTLGKVVFNKDYNFSLLYPGTIGNSAIKVPMDEYNPFSYGIYTIKANLNYKFHHFARDGVTTKDLYYSGTAKLKMYVIPWTAVVILLSIVVLVLLYFLYQNYSLLKLSKSSKLYTVKQGDTLEKISKHYKVDPKKVIKLNHLKAPYFLEEKSKLLIPVNKSKKK